MTALWPQTLQNALMVVSLAMAVSRSLESSPQDGQRVSVSFMMWVPQAGFMPASSRYNAGL